MLKTLVKRTSVFVAAIGIAFSAFATACDSKDNGGTKEKPAVTTPVKNTAAPAPADKPATDAKPEAAPKTDPAVAPAPAPNDSAAPSATSDDEILVGHYASLSGKEATFGQSTDNGIVLAIEEINAAGGLNGKKLKLITYDDKGESVETGNAVTRLITKDKVTALLGAVASDLSLTGGKIAQEKGIPMISPSSTNPKVTQNRDMVFRVCFIDPFQGYVVAKFASDTLKAKKVAVLHDQKAAYSVGLRDEFKKHFKSMGGEIVADEAFNKGDLDFSSQLRTIRETKPDAVFIPCYYTEAGNIAQQARKAGITVPLLGGDGWDSEQLASIGGDAIEGCYYSNHYAPDQAGDAVKNFLRKYGDRFVDKQTGVKPIPDGLAALGYDAAYVLFESMKRAKSLGGKDLAAAIAETKDFKGVTGTITIDKNRNAKKAAVIVKMKGGKPTYVTTIDPPAEKPAK